MQTTSSISRLPDPWLPFTVADDAGSSLGLSSFGSGTAVLAGNDAHFVPFLVPCDATLYSLSFAATNGTGNYDMGIYDAALNKLVSSGSTAMSAAGIKTLSFSDMRVKGGELYYAAFAFSSTSATIIRPNYILQQLRGFGWGYQSSALPLPSTASPGTGAISVIPIFALGVR